MWLYRKLPFIYLVVLSTCVSMPQKEEQQNLLSVPLLHPSIEKGIESSFFALGEWPEKEWWKMFSSQELDGYIGQALQANPDLLAVRSRIALAKEAAHVVRSKLFPLVYFNAEETWELLSHNGLYRAFNPNLPLNANLVDLTLSFNYEFDFWGKNTHLFRAALSGEKVEEARAAEVELITAAAVAQAYCALKTNLARETLYERLYHIRLQVADLQKLLSKSALSSHLPPLFSEEAVLEAEKQLFAIREEVASGKYLLNTLMGQGADTPLEVTREVPALPEALIIPATLSLNLLSRRPDLMAQIWRVEALANEVGAAKADFYPNINLGAFVGLESTLYALLFKSSSKTAALEPAIHLPIFTAGAIRSHLRSKKAAFDEAVFSYNSLLLQSTKEVAGLLVLAQALYSQRGDQEGIIEKAVMRLEIIKEREASGLDSAFARYALEIEVAEKQLENVVLLYGQYVAAIKLVKALGGGYQSPYALPLRGEANGN